MIVTKEQSSQLPNRETIQVPTPEIQQYLDLVSAERIVEQNSENSGRDDSEFLLQSNDSKLQRYHFLLKLNELRARQSESDFSNQLDYYLKKLFEHMGPQEAIHLFAEHGADLLQNHAVELNAFSEQKGTSQIESISTFLRECPHAVGKTEIMLDLSTYDLDLKIKLKTTQFFKILESAAVQGTASDESIWNLYLLVIGQLENPVATENSYQSSSNSVDRILLIMSIRKPHEVMSYLLDIAERPQKPSSNEATKKIHTLIARIAHEAKLSDNTAVLELLDQRCKQIGVRVDEAEAKKDSPEPPAKTLTELQRLTEQIHYDFSMEHGLKWQLESLSRSITELGDFEQYATNPTFKRTIEICLDIQEKSAQISADEARTLLTELKQLDDDFYRTNSRHEINSSLQQKIYSAQSDLRRILNSISTDYDALRRERRQQAELLLADPDLDQYSHLRQEFTEYLTEGLKWASVPSSNQDQRHREYDNLKSKIKRTIENALRECEGSSEQRLDIQLRLRSLLSIAELNSAQDQKPLLQKLTSDGLRYALIDSSSFPGLQSAELALEKFTDVKGRYIETPGDANELDAYLLLLESNHPEAYKLQAAAKRYIESIESTHSAREPGMSIWHAMTFLKIYRINPDAAYFLTPAKKDYYQVVINQILLEIKHLDPTAYEEIVNQRPELITIPNDDSESRQEAQSIERMENYQDVINRLDDVMGQLDQLNFDFVEAKAAGTLNPSSDNSYDYGKKCSAIISPALIEVSHWCQTASEEEVSQLLTHLEAIFLPYLAEAAFDPFVSRKNGGIIFQASSYAHYMIREAVTHLLATIPAEMKSHWLPRITATYNEIELRESGSSTYIQWPEVIDNLPDGDVIPTLLDLCKVYNASEFKRWSYRQSSHVDYHLESAIDHILHTRPQLRKKLLEALKIIDPNSTYLMTRNFYISLASFTPSEHSNQLRESIQSYTLPQIEFSYGMTMMAGHLSPEVMHAKVQKLNILTQELGKYNADKEVAHAKKVTDFEAFISEKQESLAKLLLFFPQTDLALSLIQETVEQHGFPRLEERLLLLERLSFNDIIFINLQLAHLPSHELSQGLISNLIALISAFKDPSIAHPDVWKEYLENPPATAKEVRKGLGQLLLIEIAHSMEIPESIAREADLDSWNFKQLPRLVEATERFKNDFAIETLYHVIVKASFLNIFDQLIDPRAEVDLERFSEEEQHIIHYIRVHNADTMRRFEERGININAFREGTTRRLQGKVLAEQMVTNSFQEYEHRMKATLRECRDLGIQDPNFLTVIDSATTSLDALLHGDDAQHRLLDLDRYYKAKRLAEVSGKGKREIRRREVQLSPDDTFNLIQIIRRHLVTEEQKGQATIEKLRGDLPTELIKGLSNSIRSTNIAESGQPAHIVFSQKIVNPESLARLIAEHQDYLREIISAEELDLIKVILKPFAETEQSTPESNLLVQPSISQELAIVKRALNELSISLDQALSQATQLGIPDDAIKLQIDHVRSATYQIDELEKIVKNARDQEYDVTVRRWQRKPPVDLFFGNDLQCCVAIENFNGYGMLQFLTGMDFELDEIIDTQTGERVGGTFDYIQERIDSTPDRPVLSYVIDNMELNPSHQFLRSIIRATKVGMSTEVFERMIVDDRVVNNGVRLGTSYNDIPTDDLSRTTETNHKLGGSNSGIAVYTDAAVQATDLGVTTRNPTAFLKTPTYLLDGKPPAEMGPRAETAGRVTTLDLSDPEVRRNFREQYLQQATAMEESLFGIWSNVELLNQLFAEELSPKLEDTVFCCSTEGDKLLGFIIGINSTGSGSVPTLYVETSNVDWNYQNRGVGKGLREALEEEARRRGYQQISRDAMADTGYAQRLLRELMNAGTLIEPALSTEAELQAFLNERSSFQINQGVRLQISILSSI